ncbi:IS1595 family transposase [Bacillus sp. 3255]|uniref:IS1595 family transposase n=1 Tax=Bacillus sp. 3255 TaxID=2817904 RepID=UPI00286122EE|nr:IS1595 family transposase [Bacillus sp. 3255]MDR6881644.1 transposase-like protein [Bacillus sp. 3255]
MDFSKLSFEQFMERFSTEAACAEYLFRVKWPQGFSCPQCSFRHAYLINTRRLPLYECSRCRHQASLTSGTVTEGSRTSLRKWFAALFLVSCSEEGASAVKLSHIIQVTYKTAWLILHKIRSLIHLWDAQTPLTGTVIINSAIYGRPYNPTVRKHPQEHLLLLGSSQIHSNESGYLKIKHIIPQLPTNKHISRRDLHSFHNQHIDPAVRNIEITTGFYTPIRCRPLLQLARQAGNWINRSFHGLGAKYLQKYLDEFCYRYNLTARNIPVFPHLCRLVFTHASTDCFRFLSARDSGHRHRHKENHLRERWSAVSLGLFNIDPS